MAQAGYRIYAPGGVPDIDDRHANSEPGYKDIALKFVKEIPGSVDPVVKEVLVLQPHMMRAKDAIHVYYDQERAALARMLKGDLTPEIQKIAQLAHEKAKRRIARLGAAAHLADNPAPSARNLSASVQSSEDQSLSRSAFSAGEKSSAHNRNSSSSEPSKNSLVNPSLSGKLKAFLTSDSRSATDRGLSFITPDNTAEGSIRQRENGDNSLKSGGNSEDDAGGFFDLLGVEPAAKAYVEKLPAASKKSKPALKKEVAKDLPEIADNPAALGDLFAIAQQQSENSPLIKPTDTGSVTSNENSNLTNPSGDRAGTPTGESGGDDDFGSLFGNPGSNGAAPDEGQPGGTSGVDGVGHGEAENANGEAGQGVGNDEGERGVRPDAGAGSGSLPSPFPGNGDIRSGRVDPKAAAESGRLARIARSRAKPIEAQNHRIEDSDTLVEGGLKTRVRVNLTALRLLKKLQAENRNATPDEKRTLAKYVGWGAMPQVFDRQKADEIEGGALDRSEENIKRYEQRMAQQFYRDMYQRLIDGERAEMKSLENWENQWGESYRQLKELLTPTEWEMARDSTINAHFTDRRVIDAMWRALDNMGFKGGRVLEPAMGAGHFFGLMPDIPMRASELFGVELDSVSGGLSQKLYPDAQVQISGFEKARLPDSAFDLAISNVPFSEVGPYDPVHDKAKLNLHNYFFAKALDKVRPGGVVAFITTAHTMESSAPQRAYLAERADLIGAVRLPNMSN